MTPIDWTDDTPRPLDELARIAFPNGGVTADSLKRRARQGLLTVTRPGKSYLSTLADVRKMVEACRVKPTEPRQPSGCVPNGLGLTETDLSKAALDAAIAQVEAALPRKPRR